MGNSVLLSKDRRFPRILRHHYYACRICVVAFFCLLRSGAGERVCFTQVRWGMRSEFLFVFSLTNSLQAVLADLSTLKVMPLIQVFLFATAMWGTLTRQHGPCYAHTIAGRDKVPLSYYATPAPTWLTVRLTDGSIPHRISHRIPRRKSKPPLAHMHRKL